MNKFCKRCNTEKPHSEFYKDNRNAGYLSSRCKTCDLAYQRSRKKQKTQSSARWYQSEKGIAYKQSLREQNKQKNLQRLNEKISMLSQTTDDQILTWRRQSSIRHAARLRATPSWIDRQHKHKAVQIYALTQQLQELLGRVFHVDHIVPLISDQVCGLHVWWNLQPLSELENVKKGNIFNPALFPDQGQIAFPDGDGPVVGRLSTQNMEYSDD
jgi:hypothetical protein